MGGVADVYGKVREGRRIPFDAQKVNQLLGTDIDKETMIGYFKMIDLDYDETKDEVIVPSFRQDLECLADMAEEVARFYGYDNIPASLPKGEAKLAGAVDGIYGIVWIQALFKFPGSICSQADFLAGETNIGSVKTRCFKEHRLHQPGHDVFF